MKFVTDRESGVRSPVEYSRRVKPWWFTSSANKIALSIRYGAKVVEVAKGKNAIEVADLDELVTTLGVLKEAVAAGELDMQIDSASNTLRAGFKKGGKA